MKDLATLKRRYQRDAPAIQLGGLASNLSRIAWCVTQGHQAGLPALFRERKYFSEWAAPSCSIDQQGLLAEVRLHLAIWERRGGEKLSPATLADQAQQWSARLLQASGLMNP